MNPEEKKVIIKYRLAQARTALDDAEYLAAGKRSPQSIVNRCYYAMFYSALALLQMIVNAPSKHSGVISLFDKEFVKKEIFPQEFSRQFHKAFELRQRSDYKTIPDVSEEDASNIMNHAKIFVDEVSKYLELQINC